MAEVISLVFLSHFPYAIKSNDFLTLSHLLSLSIAKYLPIRETIFMLLGNDASNNFTIFPICLGELSLPSEKI